MKVLTLTQPWATLVALDAKRIETRSWNTYYRGPLAIHAAKGFPEWAKHLCYEEPFSEALSLVIGHSHSDTPLATGCILAVCDLVGVYRTENVHADQSGASRPYDDHGTLHVPPGELPFGDYAPGRYAWVLDNIRALPGPVPAKGTLGLWTWEKPL